MLGNDMLLLLADEGGAAASDKEASGRRVLRFESEKSCELTSLILLGTHEDSNDNSNRGLGYLRSDGSYAIEVRIHGTRFFDGHEFVRLIEASGSPVYGGDYDDDCFRYVLDGKSSYSLITSDHMMLPTSPCALKMVVAPNDEVTEPFTLGLQYESNGGSRSIMSLSMGEDGEMIISGKTPAYSVFRRFMQSRTSKAVNLPIIYDSVSLSEGNSATTEPYDGQALTFNLGNYPLLGDSESGVFDELDCINGTITRRYGATRINAATDISSALYNNTYCFRIKLPEKIGDGPLYVGEYSATTPEMFSEMEEVALPAPTKDSIYFRLYEDSTLEDVMDTLDGELITYPLTEERITEAGAGISTALNGTVHYIEVCSPLNTEIITRYKEI